MRIPGFTAETTLGDGTRGFRAAASAPEMARARVTLAVDNDDDLGWIDCKTFPDSITCHECNAFGPGTFDCCQL
jgi:hypothetical protein